MDNFILFLHPQVLKQEYTLKLIDTNCSFAGVVNQKPLEEPPNKLNGRPLSMELESDKIYLFQY